MVRLALWLFLAWLLPLHARAEHRPAEMPPPDFPARQYIDSKGCVFRKSESGRWDALLSRDGDLTCGYPPSATIRGLNGRPRLRIHDPDAAKSRGQLIEEELAKTVFARLEPGELTSDRDPLTALPDMGPEPVPTGPLDELKAEIRAAPALARAMGMDLHPNPRLCRLLGNDDVAASTRLGRDPSAGYCDGLSPLTLAHLVFVRPVPTAIPVSASTPVSVPARDAAAQVRPGCGPKGEAQCKKPQTRQPRDVKQAREISRGLARSARPSTTIPADARHVEIGRFPNRRAAEGMARRAARLGYPLLRGRAPDDDTGSVLLLAGPFVSRGQIAQALFRFREAGFAQAVAR
ncbi:SPOR domain-containing protein [Paracoccus ravus]|uniref:SPOR domain-containing protein n=1 Tax=Paracoccus ravus TaxID=2447760 RepID=UPI00106E197C|nr:SPOR domain-containing protein [Paracoccus ravus]